MAPPLRMLPPPQQLQRWRQNSSQRQQLAAMLLPWMWMSSRSQQQHPLQLLHLLAQLRRRQPRPPHSLLQLLLPPQVRPPHSLRHHRLLLGHLLSLRLPLHHRAAIRLVRQSLRLRGCGSERIKFGVTWKPTQVGSKSLLIYVPATCLLLYGAGPLA
jgi:hypothetical protein